MSTWTTVNGLPLHARVSTGPVPRGAAPIVLVHGLGVSGRYLLPTARRLAPAHPVHVPDLPGYGRSGRPAHALPIPELADALAGWVAAAGPARATYVANSMGCQTVVDFALRYPHYVERLVLTGPTVDPRARSLLRQFGRCLLDVFGEPFGLLPILAYDYLSAGLLRMARTFESALRDRYPEKLKCVQVPTLVVRGSRDPIAPQTWVEEMVRLLPHGQLAVIPGGPHAVNFATPRALAELVEAFLNSPPRKGGG